MHQDKAHNNLDNVLRILGNPGRFQVIQFIVLSIQYHPLAFNDYMPIFYGLPPRELHCIQPDQLTNGELFNISSTNAADQLLYGAFHSFANFSAICNAGGCPNGIEYRYPKKQWSIIADVRLHLISAPE